MTHRNQALVRSLWLCIELERYDCTQCDSDERAWHTSHRDNDIILGALQSLFQTLSTWTPGGSLTLDISVYSPSDAEHAFKYLTYESDAPGHLVQHEVDQRVARSDEHDAKHRWQMSNAGLPIPPYSTLERVFAEIWPDTDEEDDDCWQLAPDVPAVTRLVMRLQTRRHWRPHTVTRMLSRLSGLHEFHYETWRHLWDEM